MLLKVTYNIQLSFKARSELTNASAWYDEQQHGLGERFEDEVFKKIDAIHNNPLLYQKRTKYHEAPVDTFPYLIIYQVYKKRNAILIVSVFHTNRHPKRKRNT